MTTKSEIYDINHDTNKVLLDKISGLERQISQINVDHYSRRDNRQSNSERIRSRSRSNGRFNPNGKLCYYHYRFRKKMPTRKVIILNLDLGLRRDFQWPFIIANAKRGISGADFLSEYNILVDINKRKLIDGLTNLEIICEAISTFEGSITTVKANSTFNCAIS
ncbi:hypothetical protein LAZ67_20001583 [Cordylochernes scorpioides]|uniref:Uncharacterized protein n=1 Tax=Cordylochernes scorpioides TaxID=51811 RepID=A0ABY6LL31_9ARAC|nr:hypothetical protein LAZ67_20001583 [Cordylochernes scorpioides]